MQRSMDEQRYLLEMGMREVGNFFSDIMMKKRMAGYVPVLVEDFLTSFFFVKCDPSGQPIQRVHKTLSFLSFPRVVDFSEPLADLTSTVVEKEFSIERPLVYRGLVSRYELGTDYLYYLWDGRMMGSREVPFSELDVKDLLRLSQEVIRKRDGLIMDEALVNSFIK